MAAADQEPMAAPLPEDGEGLAPAGPGAVLAEPGQRLLARIVDTLVVGLPVLLVISEFLPSARVEIVAPPVVAGLLLIYECVQLALWGRTLGKRFAGIQVVRQTVSAVDGETILGTDPRPPGLVRSLLRTAVFTVPIAARPVPVFGLLAGLVWVGNAALMFEGSWRQALHDRVSGTVVVKRGAV
ncbi:RDD family protein [Actinomadura adrarensis]|uniref:RDD family protein n=1 Tax=Actinomadura adrarensis TaxID=1819600 RepID=A0ABW3CBU5_9ACTN